MSDEGLLQRHRGTGTAPNPSGFGRKIHTFPWTKSIFMSNPRGAKPEVPAWRVPKFPLSGYWRERNSSWDAPKIREKFLLKSSKIRAGFGPLQLLGRPRAAGIQN